MTRCAAVILSADGEVALIERWRAGLQYYVFPGGAAHPGESCAAAMVREVKEELGLEVVPERLLAEVHFRGQVQYYFLAAIRGGEFGTGQGEEMLGLIPPEQGTYRAVWMPVSRLAEIQGWPGVLLKLVAEYPQRGWPEASVRLEDPGVVLK